MNLFQKFSTRPYRSNEQILEEALLYLENGPYKGKKRLLGGQDYICHPLRIAIVLARYYVAQEERIRRVPIGDREPYMRFRGAAEEIVADVERLHELDKDELKSELFGVIGKLNKEQLTDIVGVLGHDAIEELCIGKGRLGKWLAMVSVRTNMRYIARGAQKIIWRMTDELGSANGNERRERQIQWAESWPLSYEDFKAKNFKKLDICDNLIDVPQLVEDEIKKARAKGDVDDDAIQTILNDATKRLNHANHWLGALDCWKKTSFGPYNADFATAARMIYIKSVYELRDMGYRLNLKTGPLPAPA